MQDHYFQRLLKSKDDCFERNSIGKFELLMGTELNCQGVQQPLLVRGQRSRDKKENSTSCQQRVEGAVDRSVAQDEARRVVVPRRQTNDESQQHTHYRNNT